MKPIEPLIQQGLELLDRRRSRNASERAWIGQMMGKDPVFPRLTSTRRHIAHEGSMFVAWEFQDKQPRIRALFRISQITLESTKGIRILVDVSTPTRPAFQQVIGCKPEPVADMPLYLWVPAHTDLIFTPANQANARGGRILYVQFMARTSANSTDDDGIFHVDVVSDFCKRWPQHAF